jgi:small subunit ribosomal protein S21
MPGLDFPDYFCPGLLRGCTEERDNQLADVVSQENESFESLLRRFNKRVQQEGVLSELRRREFFEKPSIKRKRKDAAKKRKSTRPPKK